ncbi:MAG: serine hydrolase domain-containing protein [Pseudomonadota bacterium]
MIRSLTAAVIGGLALACTAHAEPIFSDDFQDGEAEGWGAGGSGDVRLTTYAGNVALRLSERATVFAAITTQGYRGVSVAAAFAADDLDRGEACVFEVSADDGASWLEVVRVEDGADDAVTLHRGSLTDAVLDDAARIILRGRAEGSAANDLCWLDDVTVTGRWIAEAEAAERFTLTSAFLNSETPFPHPVATHQYAPSVAAASASGLEGHVRIDPGSSSTIRVLRDRFEFEGLPDTRIGVPPVIETAFTTAGDRLLPAQRGLIVTDHPFWDYVLTPGRVWSEPGDGDWHRAALPFALVEKNANCVHNGLLTFLFRADGVSSRAVWQIGSETCAYFQFDAWGEAETRYAPGAVNNAAELRRRDAEERAARLQVHEIEDLEADYPGIDITAIAAPQDVDPGFMTLFGIVANGAHYAGGCQTRFGAYPYCDAMVIPSYSLAKSLFGGLGLMQLEARHPGARDALIEDYVPECAAEGGWAGVTFEHALDMTTGRYVSTESEADENAAVEADFFLVGSHADKARLACGQYPRREAPGRTWVYHTTDTYLLGTAMQAYLQAREGPNADIYRDLLIDPLWRPLGLSATMDETRRTADERAQPFVGWGLVMQRGDLARLMDFLGAQRGVHDGQALLDRSALDAALQRDPSDNGLPAPDAPFGYNDGFWSWNLQAYGGCDAPTPVPFMSGFGGIAAVFIPNDVAYYYVSDGYQFRWARGALATEAISPFCKGTRR